MTRSIRERIAALEASFEAPLPTRPRKRPVRACIRATRVLLEEAFVLIQEADRLLASTEGDTRR
jgi:hypothetical protein